MVPISLVLQAPQRLVYHPMGLGQTWVPLRGLKERALKTNS